MMRDRIRYAWRRLREAGRERGGGERGDVPGWVLVTLMTAGIVTVLWTFAGEALRDILSDALASVTGPGSGGG